MKRRAILYLVLMAALISGCGWTDADLAVHPGSIEVEYNIPQLGREHINVRVIGEWDHGTPDNPENVQLPEAGISFNMTTLLSMEEQDRNDMMVGEVENLRNGLWIITIEVTGSMSTGVDSTFCDQEIFRGQKTVITFTRGMSGCTCNRGCESPPPL